MSVYAGWVYVLRAPFGAESTVPRYQFGRSDGNIAQDLQREQAAVPWEVELFKLINTDDAEGLDQALRASFEDRRNKHGWYGMTKVISNAILALPTSAQWTGDLWSFAWHGLADTADLARFAHAFLLPPHLDAHYTDERLRANILQTVGIVWPEASE